MKSTIRWAGSKRALLPILKQCWEGQNGRYIEPFCGSACLFFNVEPQEAILNDLNTELMKTYRALKSDSSHVAECLLRLRPNKSNYYRLRAINPDALSEVETAARFLFLNRLCFNGIYRTNRQGAFNVPYARPKQRVVFDIDGLRAMGKLLRRAQLLNSDFEAVLYEAEPGDFVYLDPPYAVSKRRVFSEYHANSFSERDLARLRSALKELDRRGVRFVISYADSPEGRALVSNWQHRRIRARRNVAGFVGHRRNAYEVLASNIELPSCR